MVPRSPLALLVVVSMASAPASSCSKDPPAEPPLPDPLERKASEIARKMSKETSSEDPARSGGRPRRKVSAKPVVSVKPAEDDPLQGQWTLADATKDLKGNGALLADLEIDLSTKGSETSGKLTCTLFEEKAPITVANFTGLARGLRPWKTAEGKWQKKPAYDGTIFHRIIKGFMIQGGDAQGTGMGEPGYVIPDEIWEDALHDRPGLLCMANRGPNTNGAQFFITDAPAPHLDNGYTIFGECTPVDLVHRIASVEVKGERPVHPPRIRKVTIRRGVSPLASASASTGSAPTKP
ncbi:MAG: peptidylprolyl isomerase [Myxococcales bacterium]|nr:peptidylprolyl isomerase [Polyangiaceae bacterium]MDW8248233.1 peptidylprolyl isomerase [Myxococcales bacterium]